MIQARLTLFTTLGYDLDAKQYLFRYFGLETLWSFI
jgi:hypothetical protein